MKRLGRILAVACAAALVLAAMGAASASAASFTWSATGKIKGAATTDQVFTVGGANVVTCNRAYTTGEIKSTASTEQHVTVAYSECVSTFYGFPNLPVTITPATYNFTSNGEVHILNTITIHVWALNCDTVVGPQTLKSVTYTNGASDITAAVNVSNIVSTSTTGCPSGTTGTYKGSNTVEREGGGSISWDA